MFRFIVVHVLVIGIAVILIVLHNNPCPANIIMNITWIAFVLMVA